ncbi:twin-arginine translocase subunit TatC [Haloglomus litoreum]|uniref:twin-arginine translocase subunit TatC n=1 Tax=Haloglomus litoreum TaxID=3034026 RepID=UPI0023E8F695|nr:twin-arginine translocase subunit TatC [Haloglomus sp. DT116]
MSSYVGEDTAAAIDSGRETAGAMLRQAQKHLQKVFILFLVGLMGTIYVLRNFVWDQLKADLNVQEDIVIVAVTPFDVILLQVKIGLFVGIIVALPLLLYYSRDALKERGLWPTGIPRWKIATVGFFSFLLFCGGVAYGYAVFFPTAFRFLAENAVQSGFAPTYSIVKWAQFIMLLSVSFGLAAQLPLVMSALSYSGVVPYTTFRDYWRHAVVGLYAIGAVFTPPDPLTQLMWATPLVVLYAISLQISKFVVTAKVSSQRLGVKNVARERWNVLAGVGALAFAGTYFGYRALLAGAADSLVPSVNAAAAGLDRYVGFRSRLNPPSTWSVDPMFGLSPEVALGIGALVVALGAALVTLSYLLVAAVDEIIAAEGGLKAVERGLNRSATAGEGGPAPASTGAPGEIDLSELDEAGIRAAPIEAFADMEEDEAVSLAGEAMDEDDPDKAQAILDRFDEAQELVEADPVEKGATAAAANDVGRSAAPGPNQAGVNADDEEAGVGTRTAAGVANAFTAEETDEDDIGGYLYDIQFIVESLTSKAFVIVGLFMTVLAVSFSALYLGGIGYLKDEFVSRVPSQVVDPSAIDIVALHPVEVLIFEIKVSVIFAAVATLPVLLYFAWPALKERGFAAGDRNVLLLWGGLITVGLVAGSAVGFLYVAPTIISWLVADALGANMVIAYQINSFGWLVFFTTVGVGLLFDIPVTMYLFHRGGLVPYRTQLARWREVTVLILGGAALFTPKSVFSMFIVGIPVLLAYFAGLGLLYVVTLGGRRGGPKPTKPEPETAD